jgi:hypothetical protein
MEHTPPLHIVCGRRHWPGSCPQEDGLKARVWYKLSILAGWVTFWRNGHP